MCTKSQYMSGFCTRCAPYVYNVLVRARIFPPPAGAVRAVFLVSQILSPAGGRGPCFSRKFVRLVLLLRQNLTTCVIFPRPVEMKPETQPLVTGILPVAPAGSGRLPRLCPGGLSARVRFFRVGQLARLRCYVHIAQPCWGPAASAVACRAVVCWAVWGRGWRVCRAEGLCGWPCVVLRLPPCRRGTISCPSRA